MYFCNVQPGGGGGGEESRSTEGGDDDNTEKEGPAEVEKAV